MKKKSAINYELNIEFPLEDNWVETNENIKKALKRHSDSSGAGFGMRDMQYIYKNSLSAKKAEKTIEALKIPNLNMFITKLKD